MGRKVEQLGKVTPRFLEEAVFRNLGAHNKSVTVGPRLGFDNAVIAVSGRRVLVITADPLSIIPSVGLRDSAWLSVHLIASDFSTSGLEPQFAVMEFNLPPHLPLSEFAVYSKAIGEECENLGISIVGGHTGKYPGCDLTIVGGGVMFGFAAENEYVTPGMAQGGDKVIMTKGAAIATTSVLAHAFPMKVMENLGKKSLESAKSFLRRSSTVKDARVASSVGLRKEGVTSMHDATEGGVLGGLHELSYASRSMIVVDMDKIHIARETRMICSLFRLDPLVSLSEGTLLITARPEAVEEIQRKLQKNSIDSFLVGEVRHSDEWGLWVSSHSSRPTPFVPPEYDPYWRAYSDSLRAGWK